MIRTITISVAVVFQFISFSVFAGDNWMVKLDPENRTRCLMESATQVFNDGQAESSAKLVYTGDALYVATKSNIDVEYKGVGLKVDHFDPHSIDELYMKKTAVFTSNIDKIHKQFIYGANARLTLGFWPLMPKTKTHTIDFSLFGYTKAYKQFQNCQKATRQ